MSYRIILIEGSDTPTFSHMGRPRKFVEPVKINLILEKETKASAIAVALDRKISVSRLFEALLFKELAENLTTKRDSPSK